MILYCQYFKNTDSKEVPVNYLHFLVHRAKTPEIAVLNYMTTILRWSEKYHTPLTLSSYQPQQNRGKRWNMCKIEKSLGCILHNTIHLLLCISNATNSSMSSPDLWVILHPLKSVSNPGSGIILQTRCNMHMMAHSIMWLLGSLSSLSPETFSCTHMQPSTLCQYHRLWLLHFWNKFRHLILPRQCSNLPAFLYITTNKLFFRISKPPANLYSLFFNQFPIGFIFLCRLVHHPTNVVDHIINFLFLLSFCPPTWKNTENSVSIKPDCCQH